MSEKCHVCEREKGKMPLCGRGLPGATFADLADCYQVAYGLARRDVAAAEERGRRAGIEERDGLRALLREALGVIPRNNPMYLSLRGRIDAALAPRDSGKDHEAELRAAVERKP